MVGSGRRLHQWERRPRASGSEVFPVGKKYDLIAEEGFDPKTLT